MTKFDATWVAEEEAKRATMDANSMYRADDEHASCGVGLVVSVDGKPSRRVVDAGIMALQAVWHRGAVDADGKTCGVARVSRPIAYLGTGGRAWTFSRAKG